VWEINESYKQKLLVVEMDYWQRSYGKSRLYRATNDKIREKMDIERTIMDDLK
jgi:hypothetical protein